MGRKKIKKVPPEFNGSALTDGVMLAVLLSLLVYGSKDIKDLTDAPE